MSQIKRNRINKKALILLIIFIAILVFPLIYLYLTSGNNEQNQIIVSFGNQQNTKYSLKDLSSLASIEAYSSYRNKLDNLRGQGTYKGVLISTLIESIGEITPEDTITINSIDGYNQTYCYNNIYNDWEDDKIQGDMILAYEFNGTSIPEWLDGPMVIFIPLDGEYGNEDCLNTSCPNQGCHNVLSAGSRWVRNVERIVINQK